MEKLSPIGLSSDSSSDSEDPPLIDLINTTAKKAVKILSDEEESIEEVPPESVTYTSMFYNFAGTLFYPVEVAFDYLTYPISGAYEFLCHYFLDGNHPWKQRKYQLSLSQLQAAAAKNLVVGDDTPLGRLYDQFLDELYDRKGIYNCDFRTQWRNTLKAIENLASSKDLHPETHEEIYQAVINISASVYLDIHLYEFVECVLFGFIEAGSAQTEEIDDHFAIDHISQSIYLAPWKLKKPRILTKLRNFQGEWLGWNFNPIDFGNIPCVLYSQKFFDKEANPFSVTFFRSGTPTVGRNDPDDPEAYEVINPIFEGLLLNLEQLGETLLYIVLQSPARGLDKGRVDAIKKIQRKYPHVLKTAIIDQGSSFYLQSGEHHDRDNAEAFKEALFHEMVENIKGEYELPEELLRNDRFLVELREIIDHLHHDVYFDADTLTLEERYGFINNINSPLIRLMIRYLRTNYVLKGCKDTIDRTGACEGLYMDYNLALTGVENEEVRKEKTVYSLGFSIQVKKQPMHEGRKYRFMLADKHLSSPEARANIYQRHKAYGAVPDDNPHRIKKIPTQKIDMSIK